MAKPKAKRHRFRNMADCRRYLGGLINRTEEGVLDHALSGKLGYLCNLLIGAMKESEFEQRISELERHIKEKGERA